MNWACDFMFLVIDAKKNKVIASLTLRNPRLVSLVYIFNMPSTIT